MWDLVEEVLMLRVAGISGVILASYPPLTTAKIKQRALASRQPSHRGSRLEKAGRLGARNGETAEAEPEEKRTMRKHRWRRRATWAYTAGLMLSPDSPRFPCATIFPPPFLNFHHLITMLRKRTEAMFRDKGLESTGYCFAGIWLCLLG